MQVSDSGGRDRNSTNCPVSYVMRPQLDIHPIGVVRTPYRSKYAAPRQPGSASAKSVGVITLDEGHNFEQALEDLAGFDFIWVVFWFHENKNWKPKVLPPHGDRTKRGVFATRSPHRPNPIGLSLCRLLEVKGRTIRIENPDMLDETPVLDIKPYLPHVESRADARAGWIGSSNETTPPLYRVVCSPEVKKVLREIEPAERMEVTSYLSGLLSRDPHPHVYRRIRKKDAATSIIAVKRWRFMFRIAGTTVRVFDVSRSQDKRGQS
jgi:tRNA (adenine37-N6)-methyltransferase